MKVFSSLRESAAADLIKAGGVGVIRTDTLYGLIARADIESAVARVYEIKTRTPSKPPIVLISDVNQMFNQPPHEYRSFLDKSWPGPNSVIVPSPYAPEWIDRGTNTVAYRIPAVAELVDFISKTGPLIAPSANPEGQVPAVDIDQAIDYFGDKVDFYVDGGQVAGNNPSKLYRLDETGAEVRLR